VDLVHWAGDVRARARRRGWAGPACGRGPKMRRQPTKAKTSFSFYFSILFQDFQKGSSFKSIFEQENGIFWK
jgi:hypothetical protein